MKILYNIAGTCHSGGMERVLANKANYLAAHGFEVVIVTTDQQGRQPFFQLDQRIRCIDLNVNYEENNGKSFLNKLLHYPFKQFIHKERLKKVLREEKNDVTVSMFCNDVSFITDIKDGSRKVLEIHFSKLKRLQYNRKGIWRWADLWRSRMDERLVRRFDKFVVLTKEDAAYWGALPNLEVIPNACTFFPEHPSPLNSRLVIAVGRYTYQKGFDRLIKAWNRVGKEFPDWRLQIIGDGEEKEQLQQLITHYQLEKQVKLIPPTKQLNAIYQEASFLVMSSHYEGLPMVLIEAQAFGLPVVSFACKCGPRDIIKDGENGFLVEEGNVGQLAAKIKLLMTNNGLLVEMGKQARVNARRYDENKIMTRWINLFNSLEKK